MTNGTGAVAGGAAPVRGVGHTPAGAAGAVAGNGGSMAPYAAPQRAAAYFADRLAFHTDVSDVHAALESGTPGFVLADTRGEAAWRQARIPGAVHLPAAGIARSAPRTLDPAVPVVVHCWGPGCDGAAKAAHALALLGYRVKEMLGGIEYWIREGLPTVTAAGAARRAPDPLTAPAASPTCDC